MEPDVFQRRYDKSPSLFDVDIQLDSSITLDSEYEQEFIRHWVRENLNSGAARWFVPQASFDALTANNEPSGQRVDFLVHVPFGKPFVVEIDGPQHQDSRSPDNKRDQMLAKAGIDVVRIPISELHQGDGPNLERVRTLWADSRTGSDKNPLNAALTPVSIHRLAIALLDAVEAGVLGKQRWVVELESACDLQPCLFSPYLRLFNAMDQLWGPSLMPAEIIFKNKGGWIRFDGRSQWKPSLCDSLELEADLIVRLQPYRTSIEKLEPASGDTPVIVVRSARLPVIVGDDLFEPESKASIQDTKGPEGMRQPLTEVLQAVFAKESFRDGQLAALIEVLEGRDCAVLLPTGAGKSLIYQMAGICKPGRTIVIDPLIALIEDQQRGLEEHGIDKVVG